MLKKRSKELKNSWKHSAAIFTQISYCDNRWCKTFTRFFIFGYVWFGCFMQEVTGMIRLSRNRLFTFSGLNRLLVDLLFWTGIQPITCVLLAIRQNSLRFFLFQIFILFKGVSYTVYHIQYIRGQLAAFILSWYRVRPVIACYVSYHQHYRQWQNTDVFETIYEWLIWSRFMFYSLLQINCRQ